VISGSYWPGDIYLFRGAGEGRYLKGEIVKAKDGKNVNAGGPWESEQEPDLDSLAASPWLVDWDGDGDLDLLVGNIAGRVVLIRNEGDARKPAFGSKEFVEAGGERIQTAGDAGPHTADWDGDGLWDLLVGADDGAVMFYRNLGTAAEPRFQKGVALVPGQEHDASSHEAGAEPRRPGMRAKVCVADWNGDGLLDLLVGDFAQVQKPAPALTPEQERKRDELRARRHAIEKKIDEIAEREEVTEAQTKEMEALSEELAKVWQALQELEGGSDLTGWVWVYLRKPANTQAGEK
jgi:hypothetical protein